MACCLVFLPLRHLQITSSFGFRTHPVTGKYAFHSGIDLRASHDTVFAIMDGVVKAAGYNQFLGVYISLGHGGVTSAYGHLSQIFVAPGENIKAGDPIGITGATGRVNGEHLHLSISIHNRYIDPMEFLYQNLINRNHE